MNKCLSLVHLTSRIGSQSSGSDESTSWFLRCPKPDLDPPGTKSVSGRLTLIAAAPCSALRLNFRAGNHLPRTPQLRLPTSPFPVSRGSTRNRAHAFRAYRFGLWPEIIARYNCALTRRKYGRNHASILLELPGQ